MTGEFQEVQANTVNDNRQQAHYNVQPMTDQQNKNGGYYQRAFKSESHIVEALGNGKGGHTYGKQANIAHDITESADGVEEHREGVAQTGLEALRKAFARSHAAKAHHQQKARYDHAGNRK